MAPNERKTSWFRKPLVYCLIAGLAIVLFFAWRTYNAGQANQMIEIDEAQIARLGKGFESSFNRPPTAQEMDDLIHEYIKEEVYYREALRLDLAKDDPEIRRLLRSKMEDRARTKLESVKPDDQALQALLDKNPVKYAEDTHYSFDQVYLNAFDPEIAGAKAETTLAKLKDTADWKRLSEPLTVPASIDDTPRNEIAAIFGEQFANELAKLSDAPKNQWIGPIGSGFGIHLLRIRAVTASAKPKLSDVREALEKDWSASTMATREAKAYKLLLDSYGVKIAKP